MNFDVPSHGHVHSHQIGDNDEIWSDFLKINSAFKIEHNIAYEKAEKFHKDLKSMILHTTSA